MTSEFRRIWKLMNGPAPLLRNKVGSHTGWQRPAPLDIRPLPQKLSLWQRIKNFFLRFWMPKP